MSRFALTWPPVKSLVLLQYARGVLCTHKMQYGSLGLEMGVAGEHERLKVKSQYATPPRFLLSEAQSHCCGDLIMGGDQRDWLLAMTYS